MTPLVSSLPPDLQVFLQALRRAGLEVGPRELVRLHHVLSMEPHLILDEEYYSEESPAGELFRFLLRGCLVHSLEEGEIFDCVYGPWLETWESWGSSWSIPSSQENMRSAADRIDRLQNDFENGALESLRDSFKEVSNKRRFIQLALSLLVFFVFSFATIELVDFFEDERKVQGNVDNIEEGELGEGGQGSGRIEMANQGGVLDPGDEFGIVDFDWRPSAVTVYNPNLVNPSVVHLSPSWLHIGTGFIVLLSASILLWRWHLRRHRPEVLPSPANPGPMRLPLLPIRIDSPELLDRGAARILAWGVGQYVSDNLTSELDLENTVEASACAGGIPVLSYAPEVCLREVWLWLDGSAEDPELLESWAVEIAESLSRVGLPVCLGSFDGIPEELVWDTGQVFHPRELEAHRQTALVAVLTDGVVLQRHLADGRRSFLADLLRNLAKWPRLVFADFSELGMAQTLKPFGLTCLPASAVPAFFGLGQIMVPSVSDLDPGEIRAWGAALALGERPVERATAWALRRELGLDVSPWFFPHLAKVRGAQRLGNGVSWGEDCRSALVAWLAEGSWASPSGLRQGSLLTKALDFWERRLGDEAEARQEREPFEVWNDSPAERYLRMEQGLLRLWREPRRAARILWKLREDSMDELLQRRLSRLAPRDCRTPNDGLVPLPWRRNDVEPETLYLLTQLGLGGVEVNDLNRSGRLVVGFGLLISLGLGLVLIGLWELGGASGERSQRGIEFVWVSGVRYQPDLEEHGSDFIGNLSNELGSGSFWISENRITYNQFGVEFGRVKSRRGFVKLGWRRAREFCRSLGKNDRWEFDLPTGTEWKYARRRGGMRLQRSEQDLVSLGDMWFSDDSEIKKYSMMGSQGMGFRCVRKLRSQSDE